MQLHKHLDPTRGKYNIRTLNGTDSAERKQNFFNGSLTLFDRLSFHAAIGKKTNISLPQQIWELHILVFTSLNLILSTALLVPQFFKSKFIGEQEYPIDKKSWPKVLKKPH